ncbi:MAG TPA: response regulator [Planctomycetaceae bacterium]|nr:response regulator [Planctomycetaceae bacterium]HIQ20347.1 response regulator [Planctomycetota bacterium]
MSEPDKTVLVVDDDPDARTYLATVLEDHGLSPVLAKDGSEALEQIQKQPPDLVALDIAMPEKSGVAVYRALRENDRLRGIPVIIITGISDEFERFISSRKHVPPPDGYISKPVDAQQFMAMVGRLLS